MNCPSRQMLRLEMRQGSHKSARHLAVHASSCRDSNTDFDGLMQLRPDLRDIYGA